MKIIEYTTLDVSRPSIYALSSDDEYLYAAASGGGLPARIYRVTLNPYGVDPNSLDLTNFDSNIGNVYKMEVIDDFLYLSFSASGTPRGGLARIDLNSWVLDSHDHTTIPESPVDFQIRGTVGLVLTDWGISRFQVTINTIQFDSYTQLAPPWNSREVMNVFLKDNELKLYIGKHTTPAEVEIVDLDTLNKVDAFTFPTGVNGFGGWGGEMRDQEGREFLWVHSSGSGYDAQVSRTNVANTITSYLNAPDLDSQYSWIAQTGSRLWVGDIGFPATRMAEFKFDRDQGTWSYLGFLEFNTANVYCSASGEYRFPYLYVGFDYEEAIIARVDPQYRFNEESINLLPEMRTDPVFFSCFESLNLSGYIRSPRVQWLLEDIKIADYERFTFRTILLESLNLEVKRWIGIILEETLILVQVFWRSIFLQEALTLFERSILAGLIPRIRKVIRLRRRVS